MIQARTLAILCLAIVAGATGDTLLARGMKQVGEVSIGAPADVWSTGVRMFSNLTVWCGILSLGTYFFCFSAALSWDDMSRVVPLTGLSYVLPVLFAAWFLKEEVTPQRWLGVLLIALGAVAVARSPSGVVHAPPP